MPCELIDGVDDMHDGCRSAAVLAAKGAVPESEVQRSTDDDNNVSTTKCSAASTGDQERIVGTQDAATHSVGNRR